MMKPATGNHSDLSRNQRGFTLIELLVVIAIIALLLVIILPAMSSSKELAMSINCTGNLRSLSTAWLLYAGDNDDKIVTGPVFQDVTDSSNVPCARAWAIGPLDENDAPPPDDAITLEDRIRGIQRGRLFDYLNDDKVYHCPGDRRMKNPEPNLQRYRSYVLPDVLYGDLKTRAYSVIRDSYGKLIKKTTEIQSPGSKYTFLEGNDEHPSFTYDHAGWRFVPWINNFWMDLLAANHRESGCFAFADGHAVRHKWIHPETSLQFKGEPYTRVLFPDNQDVAWAIDHFPLSKKDHKTR